MTQLLQLQQQTCDDDDDDATSVCLAVVLLWDEDKLDFDNDTAWTATTRQFRNNTDYCNM